MTSDALAAPVVGVDGRRGGWVAALVEDGRPPVLRSVGPLSDAVAWAASAGAAVVAVDIPIGLPEVGQRRGADVEARRLLGRHGSSVFPTPPRAAVEAWAATSGQPYAARLAAARAACGPGASLSAQAGGLLAKIAEADELAHPEGPLVEVHPELSFQAMAGGPLPGKRTWPGVRARQEVLRRTYPLLDLDAVLDDDHADALAAAWSGWRIASGQAVALPEGDPPDDAAGRPMQISW